METFLSVNSTIIMTTFLTKGSVLNLELIITVSVSGANYVVRMLLIYAAGIGLMLTEINYLDFGGK